MGEEMGDGRWLMGDKRWEGRWEMGGERGGGGGEGRGGTGGLTRILITIKKNHQVMQLFRQNSIPGK